MATAKDVITKQGVSTRPSAKIEEVTRVLQHHGISGLPVTNAEKRGLGMVTEADTLGRKAGQDKVEDIMPAPAHAVFDDTPRSRRSPPCSSSTRSSALPGSGKVGWSASSPAPTSSAPSRAEESEPSTARPEPTTSAGALGAEGVAPKGDRLLCGESKGLRPRVNDATRMCRKMNLQRSLLGLALLFCLLAAAIPALAGDITERISVSSAGEQGNSLSRGPSISADGRYVAFYSHAANLVPGDSNEISDVFVHDQATRVTQRVSVSSTGGQGNGYSCRPSISADGRYVAFESHAFNLVPGDANGAYDIFVHDRVTGVTERVSVSSAGEQANDHIDYCAITADGRYVAFSSSASTLVSGDTSGPDVFMHDRVTGVTELVSVSSAGEVGNDRSSEPAISADGRYVAFISSASNLVPDDTNGLPDAFTRDRVAGTTARVSVSSDGEEGNDSSIGPAISADGRYVAFYSCASNLVPGDANGSYPDVFMHDRVTAVTELVSLSGAGEQGSDCSYDPVIAADGPCVAFCSGADNLVPGDTNGARDIFVRAPADVTLQVGEAGASPAAVATVPVSLTQTAAVAGIQFDLDYPPPAGAPAVHLVAVRAVGPTAGWTVDAVELVPGEQARVITYSPANEELPSGSGPVLELDFLVDPGAVIGDIYTLHPRDILLSDRFGELIGRAGGEEGRLLVVGTVVPPDHLHFEPIPSPQGADTTYPLSFPVRIEARYDSGALVPTYNGAADLDASFGLVLAEPAGVTVPATVTFSRGVWEGHVSILADEDSPCSLTATDQTDPEVTGESNSFAVRLKGDPTDDGEVNVLDVLRTVSITLGREIPQPPRLEFQGWAADMNCTGGVNVQDVILAVQKSLGISSAAAHTPQQTGLAGAGLLSASDAPRTVSIHPPSAEALDGDTFTLAINLDDAAGVAGFQFDLSYDGALMEFASPARPGSLLADRGWSLHSNQINPHLLRVLAYDPTATELAAGSGSLVELDFHALAPGSTPVTSDSVVLSSGIGTLTPAVGVGGSVTLGLFSDVSHDHWASAEIAACVDADIVAGYPDGTYAPTIPASRDQMAVYISRALAGDDANVPDRGCDTPPFSDVPCDYWARRHIQYALAEGIVQGYPEGDYRPEEPVDRGQMAVYVARAKDWVGIDDDMSTAPDLFPDVPAGFWAGTAVQACADSNVVYGHDDGYYHPEVIVTRDQMAVYVARAFELPM
jgi:Tol biopolymer transport system component